MRAKIIAIGERSAHYPFRKQLIGQIADFVIKDQFASPDGFIAARAEKGVPRYSEVGYFFCNAIKLKEVRAKAKKTEFKEGMKLA